MNKKIIFKYLAFSIFFVFIFDLIGSKLHLYTSILYYDVFMHFCGGIWLGFSFIWLFYDDLNKNISFFSNLLKLILFVLFIGLLWEIFEVFNYQIILKDKFDVVDTISDLISDLFGGFFIFFLLKNRLSKK